MSYIGYVPAAKPLTSADITDGVITSAKIADGTIVNADINASAAIAQSKITGSFGKVLQVVQTTKTDTFSSSSTSLVDITGLSVSITPSSTANKILVLFSVEIGQYSSNANCTLQLIRGSTAIYQGNQVGSNRKRGSNQTGPSGTENSVQSLTGMFLDSPSTTSSTTYKIQGMSNNSATYQVNQDYGAPSNDDTNRTVSVSQITVMEIGA